MVTPAEAVPVFQLNYHKGLISVERRRNLLESMQTFCKDVDIEEIVSIRVSEEEFHQRSVDPAKHFSNNSTEIFSRVKRSLPDVHFDCPNSAQATRYLTLRIGPEDA